jgi:hypothetical protein
MSVKQKLFDQGCRLLQPQAAFPEGSEDQEYQDILQFIDISDGRDDEVV